jgi:putative oxidoreductase
MNDTTLSAWGAALLRVTLGIAFLAHGLLLKVMSFGIAGTTAYFQSLGYPAALAWLVIAMEIAGGVLLIAGVAVRAVAVALIPVMLGALSVHAGNGWSFSAPGGGWEFPAMWTVLLAVQALVGAGAFALRPPAARARTLQPA